MSNHIREAIARYHSPKFNRGQCGQMHMQLIAAPVQIVWSLVSRFDQPQAYKRFIKSCTIVSGSGTAVGSVREIQVVSGLPAHTSMERLDALDEDVHLYRFSIIGGEHRLKNYRATVTLHEGEEAGSTVVVESYVVDVPAGSTEEETCIFADTIITCNLKSLAEVAERLARPSGSKVKSKG